MSEQVKETGHRDGGRQQDLAFDLLDEKKRRAFLHPKPYNLFRLLRRMYRPVWRNTRLVVASVVYALTSGVLPLLSAFVVYYLVDLLGQAGVSSGRILWSAGLYALLFLVCSLVSSQLENRNYVWFMDLRIGIMNDCLAQYMRMDYGLYENPAFLDDVGDWSRALATNERGLEGTYHKIFKAAGTLVSVLLLGLLLARLNPLILLVGLGFVVLYYLTRKRVSAYQHERRQELTQLERRAAHLTSEAADFRYGKDLRLFSFEKRFAAAFKPLFASYEKLFRAFTLRDFQFSFLETACLLAIDLVGFLLLIGGLLAGSLSVSLFVTLLTALTLFAQNLQLLAEQLAFVKEETLYVGVSFDFIDADLQSAGGRAELAGSGPLEVVFEEVSFQYPGSDPMVLDKLNFTLRAGQSYALVGVNGAGKTTLVKLLTGLYQPTSGRILIDGVDAAHLPQEQLYQLFAVVFQGVEPLALTVAENVAAGAREVDRDRVRSCLQQAGLWDKIRRLPQGMDTPLLKVIEDDGIILSGGENQKLAIARALYRQQSRMMILDEPTAALDALAEEKIYQDFQKLVQGRTALFISHRLASTRFCDQIILLDGGRIREWGSHRELMEVDGLYRRMFDTQSQYYRESVKEEAL